MPKEYKEFTAEEKQSIIDEYISNIKDLNKGLPKDMQFDLDTSKLEKRLNDPNEVKVYRISNEIKEKINKLEKEHDRLIEIYGDQPKEKDLLHRTWRYLLKPGDTEEEREYNNNFYKNYLENPYKVFQDSVKNVMTINPTKYFETVQNDDLVGELEFLEENLEKMQMAFAMESDIRMSQEEININGEHSGVVFSDEFKKIYTLPYTGAVLLGGTPKKIDVTSTYQYFTIPPLDEKFFENINFGEVGNNNLAQRIWRMAGFSGDTGAIKELKNHPELKPKDNFFLSYKAIKNVDGKETEISLEQALDKYDENIVFTERTQEEIDTLLNPIDKNYLKLINGEITQEQFDEIDLQKFLLEIEDIVKNPSKYHNEQMPDFTKALTPAERKEIEAGYREAVESYNKYLPNNKIILDIDGLNKKMDDPKQVEIYRRSKYLQEKEKKQEEIEKKYKSHINFGSGKYPLARNLSHLLRIEDSTEAKNFNRRFLKLYSKYPFEIGKAVLRGLYKSDSSVYDDIMKDDYERCKSYFDNYEQIKIAFNAVNIRSLINSDGGTTKELKDADLARLTQIKQDISTGFTKPEYIFEIPKMTEEQQKICMSKRYPDASKDYAYFAINNQQYLASVDMSRAILKSLKEKGVLDDKEPFLSYKALEKSKDGTEKEISLINAILKNDPNIRFEKRSIDEKEKMLQISEKEGKYAKIAKLREIGTKESLSSHFEAIKKYIDSTRHNDEKFGINESYEAKLALKSIDNAIQFINDNAPEFFENEREAKRLANTFGFEIDKDGKIAKFNNLNNKKLKNIKLVFFEEAEVKLNLDNVIKLRNEVSGGSLENNNSHVRLLEEKINEIKESSPTKENNNINDMIKNHEVGFFEGLFNTKATRNYRNLYKTIKNVFDPESKEYGKIDKVAEAAKAYLDYKYKGGKTIDNLSGEAKERAMFCENIVNVYKKSFLAESDIIKDNNVNDVKTEKINDNEEKVKVANITEPERKSVVGLQDDVDIENNKIKKTENTKTNTKVKVNEIEVVSQDMDQKAK